MRPNSLMVWLLFLAAATLCAQEAPTPPPPDEPASAAAPPADTQPSPEEPDAAEEAAPVEPAAPEEAPPTGPLEPRHLSMQDCLVSALANNLSIEVARLNPRIKDAEVLGSLGTFDPVLSFSTTGSRSLQPTASFLSGVGAGIGRYEDRRWTYDTSVSKYFETGGTLTAAWAQTWERTTSSFSFLNPNWRTTTSLAISQPLLRNAWSDYVDSALIVARSNRIASGFEFLKTVQDTVASVQTSYWDLVRYNREAEVQRKALQVAEELLKINEAKVRVGTAAKLDVLQAEAGVAGRKEAVLLAENSVLDAMDRLRVLIGPLAHDDPEWDRPLIPADEPTFGSIEPDPLLALRTALERRPDLAQTRENLKATHQGIVQARSGVKPKLDFSGSYGFEGLGANMGESIDLLTEWGHPAWSAGITLEYPLGNRAARGSLRSARLEERQAILSLRASEQQAIVEVRSALRSLETARKRIETTLKAEELALRQFEAEQARFRVGSSTSHQVLDFQEDLILAQTNSVKALIDYHTALVDFRKATGTLLEESHVEVRDE